MDGSTESNASFAVPGLVISDKTIQVPLDYSGKLPGTIEVFYRVVTHRNKLDLHQNYLLYLQGGPGFEAPRPLDCSGWIKAASNFFTIILLDQRGTGHSTPITARNLKDIGSPQDQAKYLKCFRADSIIRDAEAIRLALFSSSNSSDGNQPSILVSSQPSPVEVKASVEPNSKPILKSKKWSILGQSFGGFCCVTYLSMAPHALSEVLITGGIPPSITSLSTAEDVYRATFRRVLSQNAKFYQRYPQAIHKVHDIIRYLLDQQPNQCITTPSGNILSPRSFQLLGLHLLGFAHGFERLNYLLYNAFDGRHLSYKFLKEFDSIMAWDTNPLYAILHESIYCQPGGVASRWAAHRIRETEFKKEFDAVDAVEEGRPVYFTGEMVFPWMFDEFAQLKGMEEAANILAEETDWGKLYDVNVLHNNSVPVAAASYYEDMFVDFNLAQETAKHIRALKQHITNEYLHDGIRENGVGLMERLLNMARDGILIR